MKTINRILPLFFIALMLGACSKEENTDGVTGGTLLLTELKLDGKMHARYDYDAQNRVVTIHTHNGEGAHQTSITYRYGNNSQLTSVEMVNVNGEIEYTEMYTYGDGNRPTSSRTTFAPEDFENAIITTYTYSTDKVVEKAEMPSGYSSETIYSTDGKGNLLSVESSSQGEWISTTEYGNYDDKHAAGSVGNPYAWKFNSPNNHQSEKTTSSYDAGNRDRILKYTYNNDGYPTKMEVYNREDNVLVETHTYSYKATN